MSWRKQGALAFGHLQDQTGRIQLFLRRQLVQPTDAASGNLGYAMKVPEAQPAAICDVYEPHLERARDAARKGGFQPKAVRDFRPDKETSFRSFAELCVTRQIITAIKTATRYKHGPLNAYVSFSQSPAGQDGEGEVTLGDADIAAVKDKGYKAALLWHTSSDFTNAVTAAGATPQQVANLSSDMTALAKNDTNGPQPVFLASLVANLLLVNNAVPAKTVADVIALAKASPDGLDFASSGNGTVQNAGRMQRKITFARTIKL